MKRNVLAIPKEELEKQFAINKRQDVKVVAPAILDDRLLELVKNPKGIKPEIPLEGEVWQHSPSNLSNLLCLSSEFFQGEFPASNGAFALSFATEKAEQSPHYHKQHIEIYFSEHPISAIFKSLEESETHSINLDKGGLIAFNPEVIHHVRLGGLTMVMEIPAVMDDKFVMPI